MMNWNAKKGLRCIAFQTPGTVGEAERRLLTAIPAEGSAAIPASGCGGRAALRVGFLVVLKRSISCAKAYHAS